MSVGAASTEKPLNLIWMCALALVVGAVGGVGAWVFRRLIGLFHNILFLGEFAFAYDANEHTKEGPFGAGIILAPVIGAVVVAWIVKTFAPEAKGHGVPEVIDANYYNDAKIRPIVAVIKSIASAICIGSGGSVGREGPIIQIGAAMGSTLGQIIHMPVRQRITLVAAGAGAGIAATFNAPLGGFAFAIELILVSVNARNLVPVGLATIMSCYIGRLLLTAKPSFDYSGIQVASFEPTPAGTLLLFIPFGIIMGLVATLFVKAIYWAEDRFDEMPGNVYTRHMSGMLVVGVMIYLLQRFSPGHHYYIQGVGYATIMDLLRGTLTDPWFLLLLFVLKLVATCLTLGSGGSGGVFSPSLFMGAAAGAIFGHAAHAVFPGLEIDMVAFVIAGMAAGVGGTTGAVITGSVMLIEMTYDQSVTMPIIVTTVVAYAVRKWLSPGSIYTLKLIRRGHVVPEGLQAGLAECRTVGDLMTTDFRVAPDGSPPDGEDRITVAERDGAVVGVVGPAVLRATEEAAAGEDFCCLTREMPLLDALREMHASESRFAVVIEAEGSRLASDVVGVVSERELALHIQQLAKWM